MEVKLNLERLKKANLSPDQATLLYLMYYKKFDNIISLYGREKALALRLELTETNFILNSDGKFTETILSTKNVEKLFGIQSDDINFWEFYNAYPIKVGSRILRSAGPTSQVALKHEKKYLARVKTKEEHSRAIDALQAFVNKKKQTNSLQFLPQMETVLNNNLWEQWDVFIQDVGTEEQEWNTDSI